MSYGREKFEQAVKDKWSDSFLFGRDTDGDYADEAVNYMWLGWLTSRQALEGEPIGYVVPRMLEAMQAGKYCGISISDEQKAGDIAVYTHPASAEVERLQARVAELEAAARAVVRAAPPSGPL